MSETIGLIVVLALLALFVHLDEKANKPKLPTLPSGKKFPEDHEMLLLCVDQLMTDFLKEDLSCLCDYAEKKVQHLEEGEEKAKWEDLIRRINIARQDYV